MTNLTRSQVHRRLRKGHNDMYRRFTSAPEPLPRMLERALELVELANSDLAQGCPERICAYDNLITIYGQIDPIAYGAEILGLCDRLQREVAPESQCYHCINGQRASALCELGRWLEARRACVDGLRQLEKLGARAMLNRRSFFFIEHHVAGLMLQLALLHSRHPRGAATALRLVARVKSHKRLSPSFSARRYQVLVRLAGSSSSRVAALVEQAGRDLHATHDLAVVMVEAFHSLNGQGLLSAGRKYGEFARTIGRSLGSPWLESIRPRRQES